MLIKGLPGIFVGLLLLITSLMRCRGKTKPQVYFNPPFFDVSSCFGRGNSAMVTSRGIQILAGMRMRAKLSLN